MSESQETPDTPRPPGKICPTCIGEPIQNATHCPRCDDELTFPAQQHQRNVARELRPDPPASVTGHTF